MFPSQFQAESIKVSEQRSYFPGYEIAAIIPCYNEETTVVKVINDIRAAVPQIVCYVYDNNSTDNTAALAAEAGAIVRREVRQGKGNVMRSAFADVEADIYVMIDGDDSHEAVSAPKMIQKLIDERLDYVLGCRIDDPENSAYRPGHATGNKMFNKLVSMLFGQQVSDMLSGYRVFTRRFVKSFPNISQEFEIETELTIHAFGLRAPQAEIGVGFQDRPVGTESKLRTYRDGFKILSLIAKLFVSEKPQVFYSILAGLAFLFSLILGIPVITDFLSTGVVTRLPSAVAAASLMIIAVIAVMLALVLHNQLLMRNEHKRLAFLALPPLPFYQTIEEAEAAQAAKKK